MRDLSVVIRFLVCVTALVLGLRLFGIGCAALLGGCTQSKPPRTIVPDPGTGRIPSSSASALGKDLDGVMKRGDPRASP